MTKKEIVKTISEKIGLTQLKTKQIVQETFDAIVDALVEETREKLKQGTKDDKETLGRVELRNFGVFEVKERAERKARNPRTGEKVFVPKKYVVTFKPGKEMEERVRKLHEQQEAQHPDVQRDTATPADPGGDAPPSSAPSPAVGHTEVGTPLEARSETSG